jgi:ABC-type dipeptide/oligopeptide/nickel transport system ATPase subunit
LWAAAPRSQARGTAPRRRRSPHRAAYLDTTATSLETQLQAGKTLAQVAAATTGKSTTGLIAALVAAEKTEIAAAVSSGKLTQPQADQISTTLTQRFTDLVNGVHPAGGPGGFGHGHGGGGGDDLAVAAGYLVSTTANLQTQLQAGKTLAQVATATTGKSTSGLIAALVAAEKTEIAGYVTSGKLTQAQADQMTATLTARFTDFVNGVRPAGGPGHDGHEGFRHGLFQPGGSHA